MKNSFSPVFRAFQTQALPFSAILALLVFAGGCKKEDSEYPVLNAQLTSSSSTFDYEESIGFTISASDNEGISEVGAVVLDESGIPVLQAVQASGGGNSSFTWSSAIDHLNPYLLTGSYTIRFFASDGNNISYAFRTVNLNTLPLQLEKVLLFEPQSSATGVFAITSTGEKISETTLDIHLRIASSDNRNGQLMAGGDQWEGIYLFDKNSYGINQQLPTPSLSSPELFSSVIYSFERNRHYVACMDGLIREVGPSSITGLIDLGGWIPGKMALDGNELLVSLRDISGTQFAIGFVNLNSGQLIEVLETDFLAQAFIESGGGDPWVLGNANGNFVVRKLNRNLPSVYDPDGISGPSDLAGVRDALMLPSGNWLVMQDSGCNVYTPGAVGTGTYVCPAAVRAVYEQTENVIYLVLEAEILVYNENVGLLASINHNGNLPWVVPVYNK